MSQSNSNSKSNQAKHYTAEFKAKVVMEVLSGTKSFSQACREYEISKQRLSNWKSLFLENFWRHTMVPTSFSSSW